VDILDLLLMEVEPVDLVYGPLSLGLLHVGLFIQRAPTHVFYVRNYDYSDTTSIKETHGDLGKRDGH